MKHASIHRTICKNRSGQPRVHWTGVTHRLRIRVSQERDYLWEIMQIAGGGHRPALEVIATIAPHLIDAELVIAWCDSLEVAMPDRSIWRDLRDDVLWSLAGGLCWLLTWLMGILNNDRD
jgi:hypothetical protein